MRVYRRRRVFTIIVFLGVVGLIFLGFQMLSIEVLNHETGGRLIASQDMMKKSESTQKDQNVRVKPTSKVLTKEERTAQKNAIAKVIAEHENAQKLTAERDLAADRKNREVEKDMEQARLEEEVKKIREKDAKDSAKRPRGVSPRLGKYYVNDSKASFTCIDSGEVLPFSQVNDDYCDCKDGTDEPGTSACLNGKFFCQFQIDPENLVQFPASKVNDGICDCCDASDEWNAPQLPPHVALHDGKPAYGIYQWPCQDNCRHLVEDMLTKKDVHKKGAVVRRQYIAEAIGKANPNHIYGEQGEFFPLSTSCFYLDSDKYGYEMCPFQSVRQKHQGTSRIIGRDHAEWLVQGPDRYLLKMTNGDSNQCPMLKSRLTWVDFICAVDNKIISVQETEVCEYTVKFETPAACS